MSELTVRVISIGSPVQIMDGSKGMSGTVLGFCVGSSGVERYAVEVGPPLAVKRVPPKQIIASPGAKYSLISPENE